MPFFGKKAASLAEFPTDGDWSLGEAEVERAPMILRVNAAAAAYRGHPELPVRLGVAIPLARPDERGFPTEAEMGPLDEIEDALCDALQPPRAGFLVAVITGQGMREFMFYCRGEAEAEAAVEAARAVAEWHEVQHYVEPDAEWEAFGQFV